MHTTASLDLFAHILLSDFLRYVFTAGAAYLLFWVFFKKYWQHRIIQNKLPQVKKMWFEFRYSMSTVVIFALIGFGIVLLKNKGYTLIYDDIAEWGLPWLFISLPLMILMHDTWFYWTHRLMHHPKLFRHVHLVHHRSTNPSPWAAYAFHPVEAIVEAGIFPLLVFTIPAHPLVLLAFLVYMITRNVLGHLGIEFLPGWFVQNRWINWHTTTTHHDLHHKFSDSNFGLYFTWWDQWFDTEHPQYQQTFEAVTSRPKGRAPERLSPLEPATLPLSENVAKNDQAKKRSGKAGAIVSILLFASVAGNAQSVAGLWQTYHEVSGTPLSRIHIEEKGGRIEGEVAKIYLQPWEGTNPVCVKCPGDKKGKKVIGLEFLWGFKKDGKEWLDGKILDPASGEVYDSKLWFENDSTLKVRGYAGPMNLFYRTQTWRLHKAKKDGIPVTGIWKTLDDSSGKPKSLVEISEKDGRLSGRILKIYLQPWEGEDPVCLQCPNEKKGNKIVGMTILWGFQKNGNLWADGKILDPGNGKEYSSSIWLEDKNTLKVRGYWGLLFRTQTWKRVE